jgi:carboxylesterase type B
MIFVSINYRLNIFSFGDGAEKNLAIKDQRLGIEWVRKNIGAFGGSPVCSAFTTTEKFHGNANWRWCRTSSR